MANDVNLFNAPINIFLQWKEKLSEDEWNALKDNHMLKPQMVDNINKSKEIKSISKKTQYYARAMRTAYVLSKA